MGFFVKANALCTFLVEAISSDGEETGFAYYMYFVCRLRRRDCCVCHTQICFWSLSGHKCLVPHLSVIFSNSWQVKKFNRIF